MLEEANRFICLGAASGTNIPDMRANLSYIHNDYSVHRR